MILHRYNKGAFIVKFQKLAKDRMMWTIIIHNHSFILLIDSIVPLLMLQRFSPRAARAPELAMSF